MILQAYHLVQKTQVEERILVKYATLSPKVRYHIHVVQHVMYVIFFRKIGYHIHSVQHVMYCHVAKVLKIRVLICMIIRILYLPPCCFVLFVDHKFCQLKPQVYFSFDLCVSTCEHTEKQDVHHSDIQTGACRFALFSTLIQTCYLPCDC